MPEAQRREVLPFPLHSAAESSPLRYPLELHIERALREGEPTLKAFPFRHVLFPISAAEGTSRGVPELAQAALCAYEAARKRAGVVGSLSLAFTPSWLLLAAIEPPEPDSARHEAWLAMPPPPPCALCGVVLCQPIAREFPETAGLQACLEGTQLVSTRAAEEGIPEGSPEYEAASREVRIAHRILDKPADIIGVWALPSVPL